MAKWGCGTSCAKFVIVDARSGAVYDPGITVGCSDSNGSAADIEFRLTSLSAVSEAPASEELGVETPWRGASDTAT